MFSNDRGDAAPCRLRFLLKPPQCRFGEFNRDSLHNAEGNSFMTGWQYRLTSDFTKERACLSFFVHRTV